MPRRSKTNAQALLQPAVLKLAQQTGRIPVVVKTKTKPKTAPAVPHVTTMHQQLDSAATKLSVRTMSAIAAAIAMPADYPAVRVRDGYSADPSALANPFVINTYDESTQPFTTANLGSAGVALFRDVLRNSARYLGNPGHLVYNYDVFIATSDVLGTGHAITSAWSLAVDTIDYRPTMVYGQATSNYQPHGPFLYCGHHDGRKGIWMNVGEELVVSRTNASATAVTQIDCYVLDGSEWVILNATAGHSTIPAGGPGSSTFTAVRQGYASLVIAQQIDAGDFTIVLRSPQQVGQDGWYFSPMQGADEKANTITGVRVIGSSVLMSNRAQWVASNGNIAGVNYSAGQSLGDVLLLNLQAVYDGAVTANTRNTYIGEAKSGAYGWLRPSKPADFDYQQPFFTDQISGVASDYTFPLVPQGDYIVMVAATSATAAGIAAGNVWQVAFHHSVEFHTFDPWFDVEMANGTTSDFDNAVMALSETPQFCENKLHWATVLGFLRRAAGLVQKWGPRALEMVGSAVPQVRPFAYASAAMLRATRSAPVRPRAASQRARAPVEEIEVLD